MEYYKTWTQSILKTTTEETSQTFIHIVEMLQQNPSNQTSSGKRKLETTDFVERAGRLRKNWNNNRSDSEGGCDDDEDVTQNYNTLERWKTSRSLNTAENESTSNGKVEAGVNRSVDVHTKTGLSSVDGSNKTILDVSLDVTKASSCDATNIQPKSTDIPTKVFSLVCNS